MKKLLAILLALSLFALCACSSRTAAPAADTPGEDEAASAAQEEQTTAGPDAASEADTTEAPDDTADAEAEADGRVKPLPDTLDVSDLTDAMVAASFDENAVEEKEGRTYLTLQVYDYDRYDMVDISTLAEGDIFVAGGKDMTVDSVERDGGFVLINGGLEKGGVTLTTNDDGVYYEVGMDDAKCYREKGEATLELSDAFTLTDDSDRSHPGQTYGAEKLAALAAGMPGFTANNTTVTIAEGKIVSISRSFMP